MLDIRPTSLMILFRASMLPFVFSSARLRSSASSCHGLRTDSDLTVMFGGTEGTPRSEWSCDRNIANECARSETERNWLARDSENWGGLKTTTPPHWGIIKAFVEDGAPKLDISSLAPSIHWKIPTVWFQYPQRTAGEGGDEKDKMQYDIVVNTGSCGLE